MGEAPGEDISLKRGRPLEHVPPLVPLFLPCYLWPTLSCASKGAYVQLGCPFVFALREAF